MKKTEIQDAENEKNVQEEEGCCLIKISDKNYQWKRTISRKHESRYLPAQNENSAQESNRSNNTQVQDLEESLDTKLDVAAVRAKVKKLKFWNEDSEIRKRRFRKGVIKLLSNEEFYNRVPNAYKIRNNEALPLSILKADYEDSIFDLLETDLPLLSKSQVKKIKRKLRKIR